MLKLKICLSLFLLSITALYGQKLTINGEVDKSLQVDSLLFRYATNFVDQENMYARGTDLVVKVNNGRFLIELDSLPSTFYMFIHLPKRLTGTVSEDYKLVGNSGNIFLLKADQPVGIYFSTLGVTFSGPQKSMLECQMELFRLRKGLSNKTISLSNQKGRFNNETEQTQVFDYLDIYKSLYHAACLDAEEIIATYEPSVDLSTRNSLYYNFLGSVKFDEINKINWYVDTSPDTLRSHFIAYYNENYQDVHTWGNPQNYQGGSNAYPKYLAYKALSDIFNRLAPLGRRIRPTASLTDVLISERYTGILYDQVAFSSLLLRGTKEYINDMYLVGLIANMQNQEFKQYVENLRRKRTTRQQSFQFALSDQNGDTVTNADFKGKVVLLDFWFTGCKGCLALHKNMAPVKDYFKNNPNFKYVSISIDSKKEKWLQSLRQGDYTDETDVKLWTGEQSDKHPIISYYDIGSYPTMILINGKDEVVAMNPPNPYSEKNKKTLIRMISEALND